MCDQGCLVSLSTTGVYSEGGVSQQAYNDLSMVFNLCHGSFCSCRGRCQFQVPDASIGVPVLRGTRVWMHGGYPKLQTLVVAPYCSTERADHFSGTALPEPLASEPSRSCIQRVHILPVEGLWFQTNIPGIAFQTRILEWAVYGPLGYIDSGDAYDEQLQEAACLFPSYPPPKTSCFGKLSPLEDHCPGYYFKDRRGVPPLTGSGFKTGAHSAIFDSMHAALPYLLF